MSDAGLALSVVIPAYNEAGRIGRTLDDLARWLADRPPAEVLIVDDGSEDGTAETVRARATACGLSDALRVLRHDVNRGKGYSVRHGALEARGAIVLVTDADLSTPITEAPKLLTPIVENRVDLAFGSRALDRALTGVRQPRYRDYGGRLFNGILRVVLGLPDHDTQCGFKAFRRETLRPVFEQLHIEGFGFDAEVIYLARRRGLRLLEVPVIWNDVLPSRVRFPHDAATMVLDLVRIRRRHGGAP